MVKDLLARGHLNFGHLGLQIDHAHLDVGGGVEVSAERGHASEVDGRGFFDRAGRTLVPGRRPPNTPTVVKLMQELEEVKRERDQGKRDFAQLEDELQATQDELDQAQVEL